MNPNDDQQKLFQMFQQINGGMPDPYRMMQMQGYYPYWPSFPQPMSMMPPPKPYDTKYYPDQFMGDMNMQQQPYMGMSQQNYNQQPPNMNMSGGMQGMSGMSGLTGMPSLGSLQQNMMNNPSNNTQNQFEMQFKQFQMQQQQQQQQQQQPPPPLMPPQINQSHSQQSSQQHPPHPLQKLEAPPSFTQQMQQNSQLQPPQPPLPPPPQQQPQPQSLQQQPIQQNQNNLESSFSQIVNEFQLKILNMFVVQNQMLLEFKNKNSALENTITSILDEITTLQKIVEQKFDNQDIETNNFNSKLSLPQQELTSNNILLKSLFDQNDFQYQLVLTNDLEMPLFKDKNFSLELLLKDMKGQTYLNSTPIELEVQLYSSDDKPTILHQNSQGQPILRAPDQQIFLADGQAMVDKLQINEVTSHFQNGWIYLIVFPIQNDTQKLKIKPLIIQVIVKSKKTLKTRSRSRSFEKLKRLEKLEEKSDQESENKGKQQEEEIFQHDSES